jgi:Ca2+-binding EF-hand superfamily protein
VTPQKLAVALIAGVLAVAIVTVAQKASVPKQPSKATQAQRNVKELLLLMDTDKKGKISKEEWMKFMEAEFERLDTKKKGEIDAKELMHSIVSGRGVRTSDLGK